MKKKGGKKARFCTVSRPKKIYERWRESVN